MAPVFRAVLFDLGGTLWSAFGDKGRDQVIREAAFRAAGADLAGLLVSRLDALRAVRETAAEFSFADPVFREEDLERIVQESTGLRDLSRLRSVAETFGCDLTRYYKLYPETAPVLTRLKTEYPGIVLGIVSNTTIQPHIIDCYLAECGLNRLVDFRILSSEVGWRKPHPAIYAASLARAGVKPEEALFVGDRPIEDVSGPGRLGMRSVLCCREGREAPALPNGCEPLMVVEDLWGVHGAFCCLERWTSSERRSQTSR